MWAPGEYSDSLRTAGRRAALRDDPASVRLLDRALALAAEGDRAAVLAELADALEGAGDLERSSMGAASAVQLARAAGDRRTAARAELVALRARSDRALWESDLASFDAAARPLLAELEALGDDEGTAAALHLLGEVNVNNFERASAYLGRAIVASERSGDPKIANLAAGFLGLITVYGPVPAAEAIECCRALRRQFADNRGTSAVLRRHEAVLHAMQGRINEAQALDAEADRITDDLGNRWLSATKVFGKWAIELLAEAPERAEATARASLELFQEMGATNQGSTAAALLAVALAEHDRREEALHYAEVAAGWAAPDDIASQARLLIARARVRAARGELMRAEADARDAVRVAQRSDDIWQQGDALVELGSALDAAGRIEEAKSALRDAIVPMNVREPSSLPPGRVRRSSALESEWTSSTRCNRRSTCRRPRRFATGRQHSGRHHRWEKQGAGVTRSRPHRCDSAATAPFGGDRCVARASVPPRRPLDFSRGRRTRVTRARGGASASPRVSGRDPVCVSDARASSIASVWRAGADMLARRAERACARHPGQATP
jgi:tetratricopeptide (TPR) repeat protein